MNITSKITEKVIKKTILITLETPEEVATFARMILDIDPKMCGDEAIANEIRNAIRVELER